METATPHPLEWETLSAHGLIAKLPAKVRARLLAAVPWIKEQGSVEFRKWPQGGGYYRFRYRSRNAIGEPRAHSLALGSDPAVAQQLEALLYQLREQDKIRKHEQGQAQRLGNRARIRAISTPNIADLKISTR